MPKHPALQYLLASAFLALLIFTGYGVPRFQTGTLFTCYFALITVYVIIIRKSDEINNTQLNFWLIASILFRGSLLFSIPALSDDFYRFIWDGRILAAGANPFSEVPSYYMDSSHALPGLDQNLYEKLNSKHRFSSYPPVCQFIYWISVKLSPDSIHGSVLAIKSILLIFEIGTIWMIKKLTDRLKLPADSVLIYALNPLVVLEISGNVHFEGVMVFFLMAALKLLVQNRLVLSSSAYALAICTKLIPLIFLPLLYYPLGRKRAFGYWLLTGLVAVLLYIPLINADIVHGYTTSLGYYFQHFEFNASVYYLVREIGYLFVGYNIIQFAGPILAVIAATLILCIAFRPSPFNQSGTIDRGVFKAMVWSLFIYLLSSPIVHPWYVITLLALSIFAGYRFPLAWTAVIFLSYEGYTMTSYDENLYLVTCEYVIVLTLFILEAIWIPRQNRF